MKATYGSVFNAEANRLLAVVGQFCSEDVLAGVGMPTKGHPSQVGALVNALVRRHDLVQRRTVKAKRPGCHAARIIVWGPRIVRFTAK